MAAWLIRTSGESIRWSADAPNKVLIYSKRKPRFSRGDQVVLMGGKSSANGDLIGIATLNDVTHSATEELFATTLFLTNLKAPAHDLTPDMLSYSLEFVHNLREPWRHFSRPYRRIGLFDIEVLFRGEIFWSRTAFLTFFAPLDAQQKFDVQRSSFETTGQALGSLSYSAKWKVLEEYLRDELLAFMPIFDEMAETWHELEKNNDIPTLDEIYLGNPVLAEAVNPVKKHSQFDSIGRQHKRFRGLGELFGMHGKDFDQTMSLFAAISEQTGQSPSFLQTLFEDRFRGRNDK